MPFTEEERERIREALKERGVPEICPVCQKGELWVSSYIASIPVWEKYAEKVETAEEFLFPRAALPCAVVVCPNCGNTLLFYLGSLGLWEEFVERREPVRGRR